jgi:hypothetical protein
MKSQIVNERQQASAIRQSSGGIQRQVLDGIPVRSAICFIGNCGFVPFVDTSVMESHFSINLFPRGDFIVTRLAPAQS